MCWRGEEGPIPRFFFIKMIPKIHENPRGPIILQKKPLNFIYLLAPKILQNTPKLFQNYIFAPIILCLGP
jgi:hypothetical protein